MRLSATQLGSLIGLCVLAGAAGLMWGRQALGPTETHIIEAMAARYVAETGGAETDCLARPGPDGQAWITVYCEGVAGRFAYPVDRRGQLVSIEEGGA